MSKSAGVLTAAAQSHNGFTVRPDKIIDNSSKLLTSQSQGSPRDEVFSLITRKRKVSCRLTGPAGAHAVPARLYRRLELVVCSAASKQGPAYLGSPMARQDLR
ncbi:hypothetical protein SBC1_76480 (plasmid) [Caballeronia sp. SBC1]|nr:hypothetical protein SBC2_79660 [Caballeronia sp. SBC2]QIN67601.1 hypothetical protein SBC1_76480 [Caballeronia sp. SBC1]